MTTKTQHTPVKLSFDGFGINGGDEYMSRVATFTEHGHTLNIGPLLAAAPELLEACKALLGDFESGVVAQNSHWADLRREKHARNLLAAIAKAEGKQ